VIVFCDAISLFRDWRAAPLLLLLACALPSRATAECGDHVTILTPSRMAPENRSDLNSAEIMLPQSPFLAPRGSNQTPSKAPCSGPNCSRGSKQIPPPIAPASTHGPQVKAAAQILTVVDQPCGPLLGFVELISLSPISRATLVFHPPRHHSPISISQPTL
jgi:hypothetical protein